jgi:hypothetical protein
MSAINMKAPTLIAVTALAMLTASMMTSCDIPSASADKPSNVPQVGDPLDKILLEAAEKWNSAMPQQLNQYTRVDTIKAGHKRLTFYYTLFEVHTQAGTKQRMDSLKKQAQHMYDTLPGNVFKAHHVELAYFFRDENGNFLGQRSASDQ